MMTKLNLVNWAAVAGGCVAGYLVWFAIVYPASIYAGVLGSDGFLKVIFSIVPSVRKMSYGPLILGSALTLGTLVGGYVAAVRTPRNHIITGTAVGASVAIVRSVFALLAIPSHGVAVLGELLVNAIAVATAFFGAKLGLRKRMKWDRECDALDTWKTPSAD